MNQETMIVEINGNKLEVDLRTARKIETLRVGSRVKVLRKDYSEYKVLPGVIVGFDQFEKLPTITVAYVERDWSTAALKFIAINAQTKDVEIIAATDADHLELNRDEILEKIDRDIEASAQKVDELKRHRDFFLRRFGEYFAAVTV